MSILSTPAILLRFYPYSETSQILKFFTRDQGVLSAMAKGIRKAGGRRGGAPSTFSEGILTVHFRDSRELQTFKDFSTTKVRKGLGSDPIRLAGGSVLAELILQHAESDGNPTLYAGLGSGLDGLESVSLERFTPTLLVHLWALVQGLGFRPLTEVCVACGQAFAAAEVARFDFGAGGLRCNRCQGDVRGPRMGPSARLHLKTILDGNLPPHLPRPEIHLRLASDFITYHISGGNPLRSMSVLATLTSNTNA